MACGLQFLMRLAFFAEAVIVIFFGVLQLRAKKKLALHYCMAVACLTLGLVLLYFWALGTDLILSAPQLAGSDIVLTYIAAPSFYLASRAVLSGGRPELRSYLPYLLIPGAFALAALLYNFSFGAAYARDLGLLPGHFSTPILFLLTLGAALALTSAIIGSLAWALRLKVSDSIPNREEFRHQVLILC